MFAFCSSLNIIIGFVAIHLDDKTFILWGLSQYEKKQVFLTP